MGINDLTILSRPLTSHAEIASSVIPSGNDRVFRVTIQVVVPEAAKKGRRFEGW